MRLTIRLNGTNVNPWQWYGLKQNPFPQIGEAELMPYMYLINTLGTLPIPDTDYIRQVLKGFSQEFIDLCCRMFEPGKMVKFDVTW